MNILWLCNVKLPIIAEAQRMESSPFGGWLDLLSRKLVSKGHHVTVMYPSSRAEQGGVGKLSYVGFEKADMLSRFENMLERDRFDVIHIWGTEHIHSTKLVEIAYSKNLLDHTVISIQGLVSVLANHYCVGLPNSVVHSKTFRDFIRRSSIYHDMKEFEARGFNEIKALSIVNHVIGRTDWDRACVEKVNPTVHYHPCNEILRSSFYEHEWRIDQCKRHTIFVSQSNYPIKGLHFLVEAMKEVVRFFPSCKVMVAGFDPTYSGNSLKDRMRRSYYGKYLRTLIEKHEVGENFVFVGQLSESSMLEQYLSAHVYVMPSTIENSPNSLGEAMLLGLPCVASYVGGVPSMLDHNKEGYLYQVDAPYMLAHYIMKLFRDDQLAVNLGKMASQRARMTHSPEKNYEQLMSIYEALILGKGPNQDAKTH